MYVSGSELADGYNGIVNGDQHPDMLMDFGIIKIAQGEEYFDNSAFERAFILLTGGLGVTHAGAMTRVKRDDVFKEAPYVVHVPAGAAVQMLGTGPLTLVAVVSTKNDYAFAPRVYLPHDARSEKRGQGTMREAATRIVRTVFDYSNASYSNLVVGEVITAPGKWSSYPPHHHPQPEIYHYLFDRPQGYGIGECGEDVFRVRQGGTMLIREGQTHAHTAAPGYAMYYLWVIRHLDGNPYVTPIFVDEHKWTMEPGANIMNI